MPAALSWVRASLAGDAIAYCAMKRTGSVGHDDRIMSGDGPAAYRGQFGPGLPAHGAGVVITPVASVVAGIAAVIAALGPRTAR